MATHGTLSRSSATTTSVALNFTPGDDYASGTLYVWRSDTGSVTSAAASIGANTVSSLAGGIRIVAYVVSLDGVGDVLGVTAPVVTMTPRGMTDADDAMTLSWRTDTTDWQEADLDVTLERLHYPVNVRGFWYQQRLQSNAQNVRLKIRGMKLQALIHGRGESATS